MVLIIGYLIIDEQLTYDELCYNVIHRVIWEERVALAQLRNKVTNFGWFWDNGNVTIRYNTYCIIIITSTEEGVIFFGTVC